MLRHIRRLYIFLAILAAFPVVWGAVPGDLDSDNVVSQAELENAIALNSQGKITDEELAEIKHINENYPRKVVDSLGNEVVIYKPIKSIIAPNSNAEELLRSIDADDRIVAVSDSTKDDPLFFPELSRLDSIGSTRAPDSEKMLALHPDLMILSATWDQSQADELQETIKKNDPNITIARFDCFRLETYDNETEKIAYLLEKENEADEFLAFYDDCVNLVVNRTSSLATDARPQVYLGYGEFPPYGAYGDSAGAAVRLEMAGGYNIFGDEIEKQYSEIDPEKIITKNPQVILRQVKTGGYSATNSTEMKKLLESTFNQTGWENIDAVKDKRVYMISSELQNKRYFIGLLYTAKILLPDLFADVDPKALHQEYLTRFQKLNLNLDQQGVFVYPGWEEN
ncbi:MAG TPA: ABC transporter substrate-binding protein [Methanothrix sp.]|nr:ABC transporter substrate-binding protein [Methanothrix sp.]